MQSLDMTELLLEAYRLADQINDSKEVKRYLELKRKIAEDPTAQSLIKEFQKRRTFLRIASGLDIFIRITMRRRKRRNNFGGR